ncbi:MAG: polysaccharide deacetylase family protein [Treponema sp.]|jgi:peptidoglycan/xylan/chitin deacetylase (PgdA/CDA1 family)|nr:polysaccharide deacetylase family protein [Treponema sp.]
MKARLGTPLKYFCAVLFFLFLTRPGEGKIRFSGLDLSEDDRLLFKADSSGWGAETQGALFYTQLPQAAPDRRSQELALPPDPPRPVLAQLSVFPEKMELLEGGTLLVHNVFGSQRVSLEGGLPQSFPGFSSFSERALGRVEEASSSPDGRWLLFVESSSYAKGNLTLLDGETGKRVLVSLGVEKPGRRFPALWSADSRGFLYAKEGRLYFYTINALSSPPDERYRLVGDGGIASLYWGGDGGAFYYLRNSTVYRIRSEELFARALYRGFLELGEVAGKIPFEFDPNFDSFWIAPDGLSLLFCEGGRNLFYYPLGITEDTETSYASLPYVMTPRSGAGINVLWSKTGIITALISAAPGGDRVIAYRLTKGASVFEVLESPPALAARLSPDGTRAAIWGRRGLYLYDYRAWRPVAALVTSPVYSALWTGNNELIAGGGERIERLRLNGDITAERRLLCLASISRYAFERFPETAPIPLPAGVKRRILALSGGVWYVTDGTSPWTEYPEPLVREASIASGRYRVYLEAGNSAFYENIPMVRNTVLVGTFPLLTAAAPPLPPLPETAGAPGRLPPGSGGSSVFTHGRRDVRELALCFDLYDDAMGLSAALETLHRYRIRATFFLNGEFIRRHPQAARDIIQAGHEAASMFFSPIDLSDARYRIDRSFVTQGLGRNEDEFFKATGKELSLLWHPPYYAVSQEIAAAARAAGYQTSGRDVDCGDWIRAADAKRLGLEQLSAADMIDRIMDAKEGGSIIPIRLGLLPEGRRDYLFNSLEVLLDALFKEGYEILTVSGLLSKNK